jgi:hypothetical protein
MRPTSLEPTFDEREAVEPLERADVRDGDFALPRVFRASPFAVATVVHQERSNRASSDLATGNRQVGAFDGVLFKLSD